MVLKTFLAALTLLCIPLNSKAFDKGDLNPKGCHFADMQRFYLEELGIRHASVKLVEKQLGDPKIKGYTKQLDDNLYLIVMAKHLEPSEIRITLAHELVHVRQLERGQIKREEFKKHYLERSFEDEAFRLSMPLAAKFYTQMDCSRTDKPTEPDSSPDKNPQTSVGK